MPRPLQVYLCPILVLLACLFSRLRNDLYCVDWDVKPIYGIYGIPYHTCMFSTLAECTQQTDRQMSDSVIA